MGQIDKDVVIGKTLVKAHIWDTAGQEKFHSLNQNFFKKTDCCIICFDLTTESCQLEDMKQWKETFNNLANPASPETFPFMLIGTKVDEAS